MVPLIFSYILMSLFKTCDHLTLSPPSFVASMTRVYWMNVQVHLLHTSRSFHICTWRWRQKKFPKH